MFQITKKRLIGMKPNKLITAALGLMISASSLSIAASPAVAGHCSWYQIFCNEPIPAVSQEPKPPSTDQGTKLSLPENIHPQRPEQTDGCGPNSLARVLRYYGVKVSYQQLLHRRNSEHPTFAYFGLGTTPPDLRKLMDAYKPGKSRLEQGVSLQRIEGLLKNDRPVIALVRRGRASGTAAMHYIVITGYDPINRILDYTDTNGSKKTVSYDTFLSGGMGGPSNPVWNWMMGEGVSKWTLQRFGIVPNTILYVDEPGRDAVAEGPEFIIHSPRKNPSPVEEQGGDDAEGPEFIIHGPRNAR